MNASRYLRSARARTEAAAVVAGLRPYRRRYDLSPSQWDGDYTSGRLDHYGALHERGRYAVLRGHLEHTRPSSILDLGCGVGLLRGHLEHLPFDRYVGIDPSQVAVDEASARGFSRSTFRVATEPDEPYDAIVCNEVLYYVDDLDHLLRRIAANLTEGGHLLTSIYKHPGDFALHHQLGRHFTPVDTVHVRNTRTGHGWKLGLYRAR